MFVEAPEHIEELPLMEAVGVGRTVMTRLSFAVGQDPSADTFAVKVIVPPFRIDTGNV